MRRTNNSNKFVIRKETLRRLCVGNLKLVRGAGGETTVCVVTLPGDINVDTLQVPCGIGVSELGTCTCPGPSEFCAIVTTGCTA